MPCIFCYIDEIPHHFFLYLKVLARKSVLSVLLGTTQCFHSIIHKFLDTDVKSRNAFRMEKLIPKKPKKHLATTFSNLICTNLSPFFHFIFFFSWIYSFSNYLFEFKFKFKHLIYSFSLFSFSSKYKMSFLPFLDCF